MKIRNLNLGGKTPEYIQTMRNNFKILQEVIILFDNLQWFEEKVGKYVYMTDPAELKKENQLIIWGMWVMPEHLEYVEEVITCAVFSNPQKAYELLVEKMPEDEWEKKWGIK